MTIVPLYGHAAIRERIRASAARGALPASLLIHGARGIGKQRLALWVGQFLLCSSTGERPCGRCTDCRYVEQLAHPDLRWFFPRPRPDDPNPSAQDVLEDYAEAVGDRAKAGGLYPPPSGTEGIYVGTVRAIVTAAAMTPSMARRKVFIVGDAERMVPQEGSDQAANAFLKLLEEPPADTTIVLTTCEPGALLPTIRSRVVMLRAAPLPEADVRAFLAEPVVQTALARLGAPPGLDERVRLAGGAPGTLLGRQGAEDALAAARDFLDALPAGRAARSKAVLRLGGSKARGFFSDVLDSLTALLHDRMREAAHADDPARAAGVWRALEAVERAKERAAGNVSPQLLGAALAGELTDALR